MKIIKGETYPIVKLGDWVFVHGGLDYQIIEMFNKYNINLFKASRQLCKSEFTGIQNSLTKTLSDKVHKDMTDILLRNEQSLIWDRTFGSIETEISQRHVTKALQMLNLSVKNTRIVVAHCPQVYRGKSREYKGAWVCSQLNKKETNKNKIVFEEPLIYLNEENMPNTFFGINSALNGKVWRIDVSGSRAFDSDLMTKMSSTELKHYLSYVYRRYS